MFRAGTAQIRITPPLGTLLAGHAGVERYAAGVRDHLNANALVLEKGDNRLAFVSCDVIGIDHESTRTIRQTVGECVDIPSSNILIAATHTHTGPQTIRLFRDGDAGYRQWFERQVTTAIRIATNRLTPASIGLATGTEPSLCHNRRLITEDGEVFLPTQSFAPADIVDIEGPTDPTLGLLTVRQEEEVAAVVVNYATHPELVTGSQVSADYPGYLRQTIQSVYSSDTVVLFLPGAIGDLSPTDYRSPERETRDHYFDPEGPQKARRAGRLLGGTAVRTIEDSEAHLEGSIDAIATTVALITCAPSEERLDHAKTILKENNLSLRETVLAENVLEFASYQRENPTVDAEVQAVRVGELSIVTFPGEPFARFGNTLRRQIEDDVFVVSCANDWLGYFPTDRAFENGGYETTPGWVSRFEPGSGKRLTEAIDNAVSRL